MAQYDIPFLQENSSGKHVQILLAPTSTRQLVAGNPSTRAPELFSTATAGIAREANASTTTFSGSSTWTKYAQFDTNTVSVGATADHANDQITINESGNYAVSLSLVLTGTANDVIEAGILVNGTTVVVGSRVGVKLGSTGEHHLASTAVVALTATQTIALYVRNNTNTNAITGTYASLVALQRV